MILMYYVSPHRSCSQFSHVSCPLDAPGLNLPMVAGDTWEILEHSHGGTPKWMVYSLENPIVRNGWLGVAYDWRKPLYGREVLKETPRFLPPQCSVISCFLYGKMSFEMDGGIVPPKNRGSWIHLRRTHPTSQRDRNIAISARNSKDTLRKSAINAVKIWDINRYHIWLVVWLPFFIFPLILGIANHHPNWRTHIFFRGVAKKYHQPDMI